jgi:glycosyltransferase involved in cell wall biosynthesis
MKQPFISVITATYNSEKYLQKSIDCLRNQTYKNFEYIIIDGASKDSTVDILKKNEDVITKWKSRKDKNMFEAWNSGLELATGEWIAFIGSDDFYYPDALQSYVDFISAHDTKDVLYISSKIEMVSATGKVLRNYGWPWEWETFKRFNIIAHPGSLQSKKLFEKYGVFSLKHRRIGDYELLLRPGKELNALFMNKVTAQMTEGGTSDETKTFAEIRDVVLEKGLVSKTRANLDYFTSVFKMKGKKIASKLGLNLYLRQPYKS